MRSPLVSLFLVSSLALASISPFALGADTPKVLPSTTQSTACASVQVDLATGACARLVQDRLNANPAALKALQAAAKTDDKSAARSILRNAGLTDRQLADATIVLKPLTGATAREAAVTVVISCCPLNITITIKL